jgi:hypothetical protein
MRRIFGILLMVVAGAACSKDPGKSNSSAPPAATSAKAAAPEGEKAAPAAAAAGKPRVEGKGFVVEVKAPDGVSAGGEGVATITLTATGEYHLNKEFPTVLEVTAPAGVEVGKPKQGIDDAASFEAKTATWQVKFTSKDSGDKQFAASFRFAVCTETTCDPKKEALAWNVPVK